MKLFGEVRREFEKVFHRSAELKGGRIEEGHILADHAPMLVGIPPKLAVSSVVGYINGKSMIHVARHFRKKERNYAGQRLWSLGFLFDSVGRNTEAIRRGIREREREERRLDQLVFPPTTLTEPKAEAALNGSHHKSLRFHRRIASLLG